MKLQAVGVGEFDDCFLESMPAQNATNTSLVTTVYASVLSNNSATFSREKCMLPNFYVALEFNVSINDYYSIWSQSNFDTYGYLYREVFTPSQPSINQLAYNHGRCGNRQLGIDYELLSNTTYVLVVTTNLRSNTGNFSLIAVGPAAINFIPQGEHSSYEVLS
jgi:hypothetical protein